MNFSKTICSQACKALLDRRDFKDLWENLAILDPLDHRDLVGREVSRVSLEKMVNLVETESQDRWDLLDPQENEDFLECLVCLDPKDTVVSLV